MPVISQTPKITYTASGSTKVFSFPFKVLKAADLAVYVNGALVTTGYTITGLNNDSGGELTFSVAPAAGVPVILLRKLEIQRTTDYVEGGALPAAVLDEDFDRVVMMVQDVRADSPSLIQLESIVTTTQNASTAASASATSAANSAAAAAAAASSITIPTGIVKGNGTAFSAATAGTDYLAPAAIGVTVQGYDANTVKSNATTTFTAAQRGAISALTDGATITPDFAASNNFSVTLGGNRTLANPTNLVPGQSGCIYISQDATGNRTLAFGSYWKSAGGIGSVTLSTAANSLDRLAYFVVSSTQIDVVLGKAVA